jgi:osmotically-inducible protein OsmY
MADIRPMGIAVAMALSAVALSGPVAAQQPPQGQPSHQAKQQFRMTESTAAERLLEDRVFVRLAERAWAGTDFKITADRGTITIGGTVPSEQTKRNIMRIVRRTVGVTEVRDRLRVDSSVGRAQASASAESDTELNKAVAQKIASTIPGAKSGEDWWFTGRTGRTTRTLMIPTTSCITTISIRLEPCLGVHWAPHDERRGHQGRPTKRHGHREDRRGVGRSSLSTVGPPERETGRANHRPVGTQAGVGAGSITVDEAGGFSARRNQALASSRRGGRAPSLSAGRRSPCLPMAERPPCRRGSAAADRRVGRDHRAAQAVGLHPRQPSALAD